MRAAMATYAPVAGKETRHTSGAGTVRGTVVEGEIGRHKVGSILHANGKL